MAIDTEKIIARYEKGPEVLEKALSGLPLELLDREHAPGKWTIRQLAVHVADAEIVGATRLRWIAAQPGATLKAYDQDAWAAKLAYPAQSVEDALALFRALRRSTAAMLRALPAAAWENTAVHEESGTVRLPDFVEHYSEHCEHHSEQIREIRSKFAAGAAAD
jgi:hypothetical protein